DVLPVIDKMYEKGVSSVLDYSVEGKENDAEFDAAMHTTLNIIDFASAKDAMPIAVFKPTGFGRLKLFEKVGSGAALTTSEQAEWDRVENRFDMVCKRGKARDISVLIDAEESWMQNASDALVTKMMQKYNTEKPIVFNTLQMYRWDRMEFLKKEHALAIKNGYFLGFKLVRGAYLEKENERAKVLGYPTPMCKSKAETDANYNAAVAYMLDHLDHMSLFSGSHNEESSYLMMQKMAEKNIPNHDARVWFGQLYGMSDHISFNLAAHGYNVAKYIPFGPVRDVMPYLIRRAEENTSVAGQTGRELALLTKEKNRRKLV
ncbi:MAG TPA: proline dehydrogenase family protein, partial [Mariniflexile sp.]|nr:proline dehydrogenase family protein [Mariniflexile sp.]